MEPFSLRGESICKERLAMLEHHRQSIENLIGYFKEDAEVVAVILGGSVAKGCERADSDIDAIVVVTESRYAALAKDNRLSECIQGYCPYENGYFDIKYCTEAYLKTLARKGSEPSRNAFLSSKCLFAHNPEVADLIENIPVFQKREKAEKMLSFYSAFNLNYGYFWSCSSDNPYLRTRTVADIILFGFRLLLQENEVLFPCHKALLQTVARLENKPKDILEKANELLSHPSDETKNDFVRGILDSIEYAPPKDLSAVLTRFIDDNELWWYKQRPVIAEW